MSIVIGGKMIQGNQIEIIPKDCRKCLFYTKFIDNTKIFPIKLDYCTFRCYPWNSDRLVPIGEIKLGEATGCCHYSEIIEEANRKQSEQKPHKILTHNLSNGLCSI